jgi:hypothetical protein
MLPGFRFLFAAILLSMSILVFGLGAAALLRAAHEEFAGNPAWHKTPENTFVQQNEATRPFLAMLRLDTQPVERTVIERPVVEKPSVDVPAAAAPADPAGQVTPEAKTTDVPEPAEYAKTAALRQDSPPPTLAKSEMPIAERPAPLESPQQGEAAPALADAPGSLDETMIAALKETPAPANETAPAGETAVAASEPAIPAALPDADATALPLTIDVLPRARPAIANSDRSMIKRRLQARRAAKRRRIAAERARLAQQALLQQQLPNPFFQPPMQQAAQPVPQRAIR